MLTKTMRRKSQTFRLIYLKTVQRLIRTRMYLLRVRLFHGRVVREAEAVAQIYYRQQPNDRAVLTGIALQLRLRTRVALGMFRLTRAHGHDLFDIRLVPRHSISGWTSTAATLRLRSRGRKLLRTVEHGQHDLDPTNDHAQERLAAVSAHLQRLPLVCEVSAISDATTDACFSRFAPGLEG